MLASTSMDSGQAYFAIFILKSLYSTMNRSRFKVGQVHFGKIGFLISPKKGKFIVDILEVCSAGEASLCFTPPREKVIISRTTLIDN